eukprot:scaffold78233_cov26-Cyclotella_meneghiniana.AAC.3
MIHMIEAREKYNGEYNTFIMVDTHPMLDNSAVKCCPRELIRFFHRRNYCDCLKDIYYNLKENTKRRMPCFNCWSITDIRKMCQCERCELPQYCSYECAVAHWPEHKEECKFTRMHRKLKEAGIFEYPEELFRNQALSTV